MSRHLTVDDLFSLRTAADPQVSPNGASVAFTVTEADRKRDRLVTHIWVVRPDGSAPVQWTRGEEGEGAPRWSPDGSRLAFLAARGEGAKPQVHVLDAAGGEARRLTDVKGGVTELAWSPDGTRLALIGAVEPEPAEEEGEAAKAKPLRVRHLLYKIDGAGYLGERRTHLFVADAVSGEAKQLTDGDFFVSGPAWSPAGDRIAFTSAMHDDRDLDLATHLFTIAAEGGEPRRVVGGTWETAAPVWAPGDRLVFAGAPKALDVLTSLYVVPAAGGEPEHLLPEFDRNVMVGGAAYPGGRPALAADGGSVVFCARIGGCTHVFRQALDGGGRPELVLGGAETVVAGLSVGAGGTAVIGSGPESPGDVHLVPEDGLPRRLTELNAELLRDVEIARPQSRRFVAPDGTEVEGYLWGAEPGARKPLLLNVHGGPHNAWTPALSSFELHQQELVAEGWCVLALNPRGSDGYGEGFMSAVRKGWGLNDDRDFLAAIDDLVADGTADPERLAVTGYSYGGFMTAWLAGHTDRFKAAVAGGVVTNLASEYGTSDYGAPMADAEWGAEPHVDGELLARMSPIARVADIHAPLLILHGQADDRCDLGQAEELFTALRRLRREVEMVVYPGGSHLFVVAGRPSHQADYQRRLLAWVRRHVLAPSRPLVPSGS